MTDVIEGTRVVVEQKPLPPCECWDFHFWDGSGWEVSDSGPWRKKETFEKELAEYLAGGFVIRAFHCTDQPKKEPTREEINEAWGEFCVRGRDTPVADFVLSYLRGERG